MTLLKICSKFFKLSLLFLLFAFFVVILKTLHKLMQTGGGLGDAVIAIVLFALFLGIIYIFAKIFVPKFSGWFGNKIAQQCAYPGNNVREAPPEYAAIRAKITNGDLEEAIEELKVILIEDPQDSYAVSLMADILIDEKEDYKNGIGLLANYINKAQVRGENLEPIMRLTDIYVDHNYDDRAIGLLERELKKNYPPKVKEIITKRLSGIS